MKSPVIVDLALVTAPPIGPFWDWQLVTNAKPKSFLLDVWADIVVRWVHQTEQRVITRFGSSVNLADLAYVSFRQSLHVQVNAIPAQLLDYIAHVSQAKNGSAMFDFDTFSDQYRKRAVFNSDMAEFIMPELLAGYDSAIEEFKLVTEDGQPYDLRKLHRFMVLNQLSQRE